MSVLAGKVLRNVRRSAVLLRVVAIDRPPDAGDEFGEIAESGSSIAEAELGCVFGSFGHGRS